MLYNVFTNTYLSGYRIIVAGYMPPLLIVTSAVLSDFVLHLITRQELSYGTKDFCWIRMDTKFCLWFIVPASFLVLVNLFILGYVMTVISNNAKNRSLFNLAKGIMCLVFLLGSSFTIGFIYLFFQSFYIALFFNLLNSLQGVGILIFQITLNPTLTNRINRKLEIFLNGSSRERNIVRRTAGGACISRGSILKSSQRSGSFNIYRISSVTGQHAASSMHIRCTPPSPGPLTSVYKS